MDKKEKNLLINIVWKPFVSALFTMSLIISTELNPILIGVNIGIASSIGCYMDLKKYIKTKENRQFVGLFC